MKINCRQFSIIIFYLLVSLKFLALPSLVYLDCETDSWLVFVLMAIIDILLIWVIIHLLRSSDEKNFYEFLKNRMGLVVAKIICVAFLSLFMLDIVTGIIAIYRLLVENFYTELDWYIFLIPLLIIISFVTYKGLRNIGRVCEVFVWFAIIGLIFVVTKSMVQFEPTFFLPSMTKGIMPVIKSLLKHATWYGSPIVLLFMFGEVNLKKINKNVIWRYILIAVAEVLFLITVFYGVFKSTAGLHSFALTDLSQVASSASAFDEISWFAVSLWVVVQILQLTIFFYGAISAFMYIFNVKNSWLPKFILEVALVIFFYVDSQSIHLDDYFDQPLVVSWEMSIKYGLLLIIVIVNMIYLKIKRKKKNAKT